MTEYRFKHRANNKWQVAAFDSNSWSLKGAKKFMERTLEYYRDSLEYLGEFPAPMHEIDATSAPRGKYKTRLSDSQNF